MSQGIWVSPDKFIDFSEQADRSALQRDVFSRSSAWDFSSMIGLLPDPDPVLMSRGDGVEVLEGLMGDAHLTSVVQTRKLGTLRREFRWKAGSVHDEEPGSDAERLRKDLAMDLERVDMYGLIGEILDAPYYGYTPVEIVWQASGGRMRIKDLSAKPRDWFGFDSENRVVFFSQSSPHGEQVPFGKLAMARHFATYRNPYGMRLLSRCFWPITFKRGGIKFWAVFAEKYGMPFLLGRYPKGTPETEQRALLQNLAAMVQDAVAVVQDGSSVELIGGQGSGKSGGSVYQPFKAAMDAEVSKAIMGQTLTAETSQSGGAYSQSKTHESVLEVYREADEALTKSVMDEIAWLYGQMNGPGTPTPVFEWWEEDDPRKDFAERDRILVRGDRRIRFSKNYYVRRYGFQEDDLELVEIEQGPQFSESQGFTSEQQALEDLADGAMSEAVQAISAGEDKLLDLIKSSSGFDEAIDRVLRAFPDLTGQDLQEQVEQAVLAADLFGRWSAIQEQEDNDN